MERFDKLSEAMAALSWAHPFWASLIYDRLTLRVTDKIPTLAVDGHNLYVNQEYFETKCDPLERIFALAHEVSHAMYFHPQRWQTYLENKFDGEDFDPHRANIAGDLIINAGLVKFGVGKIKRHDPPQAGDWLLSGNVRWDDSFEDVYRMLEPPPKPPGQSVPGSGDGQAGPDGGQQMPNSGGGTWMVNPHPDRDGRPETLHAPRSQDTHIAKNSQISELEWKQSVESAALGAKSMGKWNADMQTLVDEFVEVKRDWTQELRDYFVKHRGRDRRNWRRSNKRKMRQSGVYVPTRQSWKVGPVLIIEDWSGSISANESGWFKGTMAAILTDCKPKELRVLGVTTRVCDDQYLKTPADLERWTRRGSGCTDMEAGFRHVIDEGWAPEVAVVLTDGYTDFTDPPPFPVIWVTTSADVAAFPYGRAVKME